MSSIAIQKLMNYVDLMRVNKPIGFLLLLWPTLMAVWIAGHGNPSSLNLFIFVSGVFIMRSLGCVINDFMDQKFDGQVERTKKRPLVSGRVSKKEAILIIFFLSCIAFILVLFLNAMTILLSCLALFLASIYPLMKRYTHFPQIVLGLAFGIAIPMAFTAERQTLPIEAYILYLATLFWVLAYDTQYAMADKKDDMVAGVKSTAIFFGPQVNIAVFLFGMISFILFLILGFILNFGFYYYLGFSIALGFCLYQQYLIRDHDPKKCIQAFLSHRYVGAALFLGLVLEYQGPVLSSVFFR